MSETNSPSPERDSFINEKKLKITSGNDLKTAEEGGVPKHLFLSPTLSYSALSSSSLSSQTQKNIRNNLDDEESVTSHVQKSSKQEVGDSYTALSSTTHSQDCSSSDSENLFSVSKKTPKSFDIYAKPKSRFKGNKIHDFESLKENDEGTTYNKQSNLYDSCTKLPKRDDRRSSVGGSSVDNDFIKSITSASELSYKERIRERFNTVKEKAVESLSRPHSRLHTELKKQNRQNLEDSLKKEEYELSLAIKRHEEVKKRWQEAYKASLEETKSLGENNFFAENKKASLTTVFLEEKAASSPDNRSLAEDSSDTRILTSDLLGFKDEWDLVEFVKPVMTKLKDKKLWEEKLFYPLSKPVSVENKLEPGLLPRNIEEEGLYVGTKVDVPKSLKNKLEQRLTIIPEGRKWFDRNGELISSICPLKVVPTRPYPDDETYDISKQLLWKPATSGDKTYRHLDISENSDCVLDIDISSIEFSHHPLFSREHVLIQRLKELYFNYKKRKEMDALNVLNGRLNALRKARDNLIITIEEEGKNSKLNDKLAEYTNDIKEVRQMRYAEGRIDKQLKNKILLTWKDVLKLREHQGYQCTTFTLNVKKNLSDNKDLERVKWLSDLKLEIKEVLEDLKNEYEKALDEYKKAYELWNSKIQNKEDEDYDGIEQLTNTESTQATDSEKEVFEKKPKPPKHVLESEVEAEITEKFKESFRTPEEPEFEFSIAKDLTVESTSYNNKEEMRKNAVNRCLIFIKLFYNGKEVCKSKSCHLSQKFTVNICQRFALRILELPESLMLEIYEESGGLSKNLLVPGIYLPLPDSFTTVAKSEIVRYEFSSDVSSTYHHTAVGSGNEIVPCPDGSDFNNQPLCLYTSGTVVCRLGWVDDDGKILAPAEKNWFNNKSGFTMTLSDTIFYGGAFDVAKLREWAEKTKLDPNDPYNSAFFRFLESAGDIANSKPTYFRLNPLLKEFDFCDENDIENNPRLKLLRLRNSSEPEFKDVKMIPLNEKHIHRDIFKEHEKKKSTEYILNEAQLTDPIDVHRAWGKKYLEEVQQMLLKQCRVSRHNKRYHDVIIEDAVPDIGTLGLSFMKWLQPKRPLRPIRKERKRLTSQNISGQDLKIIVNVVRAFEVPVRKDIENKVTNGNFEGFSLVNVRPFVEISFLGVTVRTTAAEGANPTWNQNLQIPISNKNNYFSSNNFQSNKDSLYLHLFDEIVIDLIEDDSARETNIHQRLEKHWLGSLEIPFSTLYFNSRIEGTFKLYSPPILLGYEREAHRLHFSGSSCQEPLLPQRDATYITLFVSVQPALNPPKPIEEKMACREAFELEKHLEGWLEEVTNMFPHRKIKALVLDITGKSVCVTRFIKALTLPPIIKNEDITPELLARFVAMIPLATESAVSPGFFDIWLNGDQVLRLLRGDSEDHAILLCCYFLTLKMEAYILLGLGIPHGFSAYVLVKEVENKLVKYYVWDPTNGQKYNIDDSFCPLQKVYCVINDQNIWANVQDEEMPRRTRFDLNKRSDWFPAFGKNISAPNGSVQPDLIDYRVTSKQAVDFLQDKIEKKLRDHLMKWRKKQRTQWNRYCAATLRKLLPSLELATWNSENQTPDHIIELQPILASHKMCGFPINLAFNRVEEIIEAVKATGVHWNEVEGVEFSLAVYIHPYPNNILSVWVYVASLLRKR